VSINTADPLDEFRALKVGHANGCSVGKIIQDLPEKDAEALKLALKQPLDDIEHAVISRWLGTKGHKITASTIGRHRNDECSCARANA